MADDEFDAILADSVITVRSYDVKSKSYQVTIPQEPDRPKRTSYYFLSRAIEGLTTSRAARRPADLVGNEYQLDRDLMVYKENQPPVPAQESTLAPAPPPSASRPTAKKRGPRQKPEAVRRQDKTRK